MGKEDQDRPHPAPLATWVHQLQRHELEEALREIGIDATGSVDTLRRRLKDFHLRRQAEIDTEMNLEELATSLPTVTDEVVDTVIVSSPNASISTSTIGYVVANSASATSLTWSIALTRPAVPTPVISRPVMPAAFPWAAPTSATGAVPRVQSPGALSRPAVPLELARPASGEAPRSRPDEPSAWTYSEPHRLSPSPSPTATRPTSPSLSREFRPPPPKRPSLVPPPAPTQPRRSCHSVQSCYAHPRDTRWEALDLVRKSRVYFDGETDPMAFLERAVELQEHFGIASDTMLTVLPEMFTDKALEWYRNNRALWYSWDDFVEEFRDFYMPNYEEVLEDQIVNRRQRPGEAGRDFIQAMQTLTRRLGGYSPQAVVRRLYSHLLPEYRQYIRRRDFQTIGELVRLTDEYEQLQKEVSSRPPVPPPNCTSTTTQIPAARFAYAPRSENRTLQPSSRPVQPPTAPPRRLETIHPPPPSSRPIQPPTGATANTGTTVKCWRCGESGHYRSACRKRARLFCSRCGRSGIMSRECPCDRRNEREVCVMSKPSQHPSKPSQQPSKPTPLMEAPLKFPDNRPHVAVTLFGTVYDALLDTGAVSTFIGQEVATVLRQRNVVPVSAPQVRIQMAHGDIVPSAGSYDLEMKIGDVPVTVRAAVFPTLTTAMVLGMDFLHANAIAIDIPRRVMRCHRPTCSSATTDPAVPLAVQSATVLPPLGTLSSPRQCRGVEQPVLPSSGSRRRPRRRQPNRRGPRLHRLNTVDRS
ncbi:uncharacterized protein LOC135135941 [Zophobas morio]|uniref:uncharacterized protein LOC135135941 n=1 Tax=Zophobas morio TaxID=2755281 RepID=UPI0030829284